MRWIFLILAFASAGIAYTADTPGMIGVAILLSVVFSFVAVLAFVQARIEGNAQSHATVLGSKDVQLARQKNLHKQPAHSKARQQGAVGDTSASSTDSGSSRKAHAADDNRAADFSGDSAGDGGGGGGVGGD